MGFFTEAEKQSFIARSEVPDCGKCKLGRNNRSAPMPIRGRGRMRALVLAEIPVKDRPGFADGADELLKEYFNELGWSLDRDCWIISSVCCEPSGGRIPTDAEIAACRPKMMKTVRELKPKFILLFGPVAIRSFINGIAFFKNPIASWSGYIIPWMGSWVCPLMHPGSVKSKNNRVPELLMKKQLAAALSNDNEPPDPLDVKPKLLTEPSRAAGFIEEFIDADEQVAFDYETDRLKPDHSESCIASCAISNGTTTIAYPWVGEAVEVTREFLWSRTPKIGWNIKYEERWTRKVFGRGVRNWAWDGMQAAHIIDNRTGVTGLKFQAFARHGVPPYAGTVEAFLKSDSSNKKNKVLQAKLEDLLHYNGMDALLTWMISRDQQKEMGHEHAR